MRKFISLLTQGQKASNVNEDPIIAEIRRYRAEHAEKYGHNLGRICEALREAEAKSGRKVVNRKPRLLPQKTDN